MNLLADIFARKRRELAGRAPQAARVRPPARGFTAALLQHQAGSVVNVIAEVKRRGPSGGTFPHQDLVHVARGYEAGGASAISVLTDDGVMPRLRSRAHVLVAESGLKTAADFAAARAAGADAVLVGESLLRDAEPGQALALLLAVRDGAK